jgi:hypothetical protein
MWNASSSHYARHKHTIDGRLLGGDSDLSAQCSAAASGSLAKRPLCADIVAKVFLGWRTKILRAADAFYARRREGPYRFIQNRSRTSVVALKGDAAVEKSKDQLSRDFPRRSIFDFCNNIRHNRTFPQGLRLMRWTSARKAPRTESGSRQLQARWPQLSSRREFCLSLSWKFRL